MFKILNEYYYLDLDELEKYVQVDSDENQEENEEGELIVKDKEAQVHLVKYDTCKMLMEVIFFDKDDDVDEKLGNKTNELSIPFKLEFNTLLNKKIINKL